nr:ATP synthase F0 subunit 8 [Ogadenus brumpti ssp. 1 BJM-2017]QLD96923.1 ATP synthase F0 subunit 8 [Ogadenus brumpti ssp. 1 BJM-2017]UYB77901.1 ATP synthase F0 subunit 8 [Ogadenus brumpti]UYB77914.1 ATP synthase F0 subunit 8 [Ogadenus brumpti]
MPQLFPMNWGFLTLMFLIIILFSFTLIYHNFLFLKKAFNTSYKKLEKNWKW